MIYVRSRRPIVTLGAFGLAFALLNRPSRRERVAHLPTTAGCDVALLACGSATAWRQSMWYAEKTANRGPSAVLQPSSATGW